MDTGRQTHVGRGGCDEGPQDSMSIRHDTADQDSPAEF